jgi:hypothetical protein
LPELHHLHIEPKFGQFADADLAALAQCCPNVENLFIDRTAAHAGADPAALTWQEMQLQLAPLRLLTQCTCLIINGLLENTLAVGPWAADSYLHPGVLAELTSLHSLTILPPSVVTKRSLMMLAALTQLTHLKVETGGAYYTGKVVKVTFESKVRRGNSHRMQGTFTSS